VGIAMIEPSTIEKLNEDLEGLVGESVDEVRLELFHWVIRIAMRNQKTEKASYTINLAHCSWQILHQDSIVYSYQPIIDDSEEAQEELTKLLWQIVRTVNFNTQTLSLQILFENGYSLTLFYNKEKAWEYIFSVDIKLGSIMGHGHFYHIKNDTVLIGDWSA
jgi:hypothetical protein